MKFVEQRGPMLVFEMRDWERRLLSLSLDCGGSLPDEALSREALYD